MPANHTIKERNKASQATCCELCEHALSKVQCYRHNGQISLYSSTINGERLTQAQLQQRLVPSRIPEKVH